MNNVRRKQLFKLLEQLEQVREELETLKEEEEEYRDNMPENLWGSEKFEKADEACNNMETAIDDLEEAFSFISEATA